MQNRHSRSALCSMLKEKRRLMKRLLLTVFAALALAPAAHGQTAAVSAPVVGKVVDAGGRLVKDAAVFWIERRQDGFLQRRMAADTDAQGQFRFPEAPPKPGEKRWVTLLTQAADWGLTFQLLPNEISTAMPLTVHLQPPIALCIPFVDQAGKPVPNVQIRVSMLYLPNVGSFEIPAAMHGRWEQKTDGKGECVFPGLPQGAQVRFDALQGDFASLSYEDLIPLGSTPAQQAAPMRLLPGGTAQGQVTNAEDGKPVSGIRVGAQAAGTGEGWGEAVTDAGGRYRITRLRPGSYNIALFLSGEREKTVTARAFEKTEIKPGAAAESHDFLLIKGARITGKVTDKSTGRPLGGVMIGIYGPAHPRSGAGVQNTTTGPDGSYQVRVPAGAQYVYVMGLPSTGYERPAGGVTVTVGEDASLTQDFTLNPSLVQGIKPVHGHVIGMDGKPAAGAVVTLYPVSTEDRGREVHADAGGAFTVAMAATSARLRARSGVLATESALLVSSGAEVTLRLAPNVLFTLSGQVQDDKGRPITDARVVLFEWWLDSGQGNTTARTDAKGRFVFADIFPDVRYSVSAEAAGYGTQNTPVTQYKPGEKAEAPPLQLARADSFVAGHVVDDNGDPLAKQFVRLQGRASKYQEAVTDAQGYFHFEGVVNEPLILRLYDDNGFSPEKRAQAGDRQVIIVRKSPRVPTAKTEEEERQAAAHKLQEALVSQSGPALKTAGWLNRSLPLPEGLRAKIVLIDFWAISCGPCVASLPAVQKVSEQFSARGVVVVGMHASGIDPQTLGSFVKAHKLTYPIAIDADDPGHQTFGQTMRSYGVDGIPVVAVLDRDGIVRYLGSGLEGAVKVIGDLLASRK